MTGKQFQFRVKIQGEEAGVVSAITPPINVPEVFGTRGRVPVRGTINGFAFRSSLMPMGGCHMMPVNKTLCEGAGVKPGDLVNVVIEHDTAVRSVEAPSELTKELAKDKKAQQRWEKMSYSHKKEIAVWISAAKKEETRERRVAKAIRVLTDGAKWSG